MTEQTPHSPALAPVTGIVGLGPVGEALLHLLLSAGHRVVAVDTDFDVLARVARRVKAVHGDGPEQQAVTFTCDHALLRGSSVVVEAVPDTPAAKALALSRITAACPPGTTLVTTTASLPVARLAIGAGRPADLVGLRLFTPPGPGGPAEPVSTPLAAKEATAALHALIAAAGLTPVEVGSGPAADATALVLGLLNRSVVLLDEGYATHHDIDTAMRLGCGLPAGPLESLDRIGLDTAHAALMDLWRRTGDSAFEPAPLLSRMVAAKLLGRKTGGGFYAYDETGARLPAQAGPVPEADAAGVRRVGVVGSGAMARGIAEVTAAAGHPTVLVARSAEKADAALAAVANSLARAVRRGKVTAEVKSAVLARLHGTDDLAALADCDLVVEAVAEKPEVKRTLFRTLGRVCAPGAVLATTTSSLSVTACAEASGRPCDVVGIHFFNPAPVMRLVELVRTDTAAPRTLALARAFCRGLGKTAVECTDRTGFIVNNLLFPYLGAALALLDRPGADDALIERTDAAVQHGFSYPMGPFALLDTIGLDVSLAIQQRLHDRFKTPEHKPSNALVELLAAGFLGRKNGRGLRTAAVSR
uniref:3-hydroxyacyl-CoA dehydrogenase NAD-binding domain-containing protein n=1 Tax=Streptomyces sp. NBC_01393 TaxID=2903851 RepID=A0AAU3HML2_9ACTN